MIFSRRRGETEALLSFFLFFFFLVQERWWERGNLKKKQISIIWLHAKVPLRLGYRAAAAHFFFFSPNTLGRRRRGRSGSFPILIVHMYVHMTFGRSIIDRPEKEGPLTANNAALCNNSAPTTGQSLRDEEKNIPYGLAYLFRFWRM